MRGHFEEFGLKSQVLDKSRMDQRVKKALIKDSSICNQLNLLAVDSGRDVISKSMQLLSGTTGQAYNVRKNRKGAFWEDRFYTTKTGF